MSEGQTLLLETVFVADESRHSLAAQDRHLGRLP
jgi:hypothetical protein